IGQTEREFTNKEFLALKDEIDRIANATEFNGTRLLTGNTAMFDEIANAENTFPLEIQVGKDYNLEADALDQNNPVNIIKIDLSNLNAYTEGENSLNIGRGSEGTRV